MPHSSHYPLTTVIDSVVRLQPTTVLDVGCGYGKWGFLVREALDFVNDRHGPSEWHTRIDGVEIFAGYSSPLYDWVYDSVRYGDIRRLAPTLPAYDLVLLGDVIEHMSKDEGRALLRTVLSRSRNAIVATPRDFFTQEILDNPHEAHLSVWGIDDFGDWCYDYQVVGNNTVVVTLAGLGSTWPDRSTTRASRIAHKVPLLGRHSLSAAVVKSAAARSASRLAMLAAGSGNPGRG